MMQTITKCRICRGSDLSPVMSLGDQVLTGVFPKSREHAVSSGPVDLVRCSAADGCGLVQLKQSYDISEMYGMNYGYRSGLNLSMVNHLQAKVQKILSLQLLEDGDVVIDIGSNDATTLRAYPQDKYKLIGVDPTGRKFTSYYPSSIQLVPDFFSADVVAEACGNTKAKVITSFSMFYDLEDPVAFAKEIAASLDDAGVWVFEQSYLPAMLRTNSFDTICHEHLEFYGLKQIDWIARHAGLKLIDVEFNEVNGGSFSVTAAKWDSVHEPNYRNLEQVLKEEADLGLDTAKVFDEFKAMVEAQKQLLMNFLIDAKNAGKRVCGLGASTKGNVLLQYYGITQELLSEIGEVNEDKFGCYTPGTHIPLVDEKKLLASNPDYLLVLPWHFRSFFLALPSMKGRKLVFPLPKFEIVAC